MRKIALVLTMALLVSVAVFAGAQAEAPEGLSTLRRKLTGM